MHIFCGMSHITTQMGVVRATLFLVGVSIGAGFISGAELVSFLACKHIVWAIALFAIAFFLLCFQLLSLGKKYNGYEGAFRALFGKKSEAALWVMPLFSLVPCAGMLSGLDALLPRLAPLPSLCGIAVVLIVLRFGMKGMSGLNLVLVPVLLAIIFTGGRPLSYDDPTLGFGGFGWLSYAGMNAFLALPTLLDAGREVKSPLFASLFSSVVTAIVAAVVLGQIVYEGANALRAELPLLYVMRESVFFLSCFGACDFFVAHGVGLCAVSMLSEQERESGNRRKNSGAVSCVCALPSGIE